MSVVLFAFKSGVSRTQSEIVLAELRKQSGICEAGFLTPKEYNVSRPYAYVKVDINANTEEQVRALSALAEVEAVEVAAERS